VNSIDVVSFVELNNSLISFSSPIVARVRVCGRWFAFVVVVPSMFAVVSVRHVVVAWWYVVFFVCRRHLCSNHLPHNWCVVVRCRLQSLFIVVVLWKDLLVVLSRDCFLITENCFLNSCVLRYVYE